MHEWTKEEVQIIKAAWATDAGRVALEVIVGRIAGLHGTTYNDNALRMAHSEGRRSVGHDLMRAINLKIENIHATISHLESTALDDDYDYGSSLS